MTLEELVERKDEILANSKKRKEQLAKKKDNRSWQDILIEDPLAFPFQLLEQIL
jgi:hypothetical protein